jgi:putative DNA primase/helicase
LRQLSDGCLIVPLCDENGALRSLQSIDANGEKRYLPGGRKRGCFHLIGKIDPHGQILIAEGYATAASLHEATGLTVAVACDCANLQPVGEALRKKYPAAMLIFCADDDAWTAGNPGAAKAKDAAQAVGGKIALPKFAGPRMEGQTDFNDLARRGSGGSPPRHRRGALGTCACDLRPENDRKAHP